MAPAYATLYPGLAEIAQRHGYALAIHGSLLSDLDLIAIPWIQTASTRSVLVDAIKNHCYRCFDKSVPAECWKPESKPHGRIAWKVFFDNGASVDLSVLPLTNNDGY